MKITAIKGIWLRYKDTARPIVTLERRVYAFNNDRRECLVSEQKHIAFLLAENGRYEVSGVEVDDPVVIDAVEVVSVEEPVVEPNEPSENHSESIKSEAPPRVKRAYRRRMKLHA